ncbi:unnamed protein product [Euphydryas editha]|uniref:Transposase n=1 Tax=Euphydryas editha TaxID=104508 RepID=A0AAU9V2W3_EUPED|nr:unnamed protein product [Euphydryas editha]
MFHKSKSTIQYVIQKWKKFGTSSNLPRKGLSKDLSTRDGRHIMHEVRANTFVSAQTIATDLAILRGKSVGADIVRKVIRKSKITIRSILLRLSRTGFVIIVPHQLKTPSQSPDLSPLEKLWSFLDKNLRTFKILNINELKQHM